MNNGIQRKFIDLNGLTMSYEERGVGRPVVLIHGFGVTSYTWRDLQERLPKSYRFIAIDLKGSGHSDKPRDGRYSLGDQSRLVVGLIKALDLHDFVIVGHSFGGGVALFTALRLQDMKSRDLRGLVLVDSVAYSQPIPSFIGVLRIPVLGPIGIRLTPPRSAVRAVLKKVFYKKERISDELVRVYAHFLCAPGARQALIATAKQIIPPNLDKISQRYRDLEVPTLVMSGIHDLVVPPSIARRLAQDLPQAEELILIDDCGHAPQEERPSETAKVVEEFLERMLLKER